MVIEKTIKGAKTVVTLFAISGVGLEFLVHAIFHEIIHFCFAFESELIIYGQYHIHSGTVDDDIRSCHAITGLAWFLAAD